MPYKDPASSREYYQRNRSTILQKAKERRIADPANHREIKKREYQNNRERYLTQANAQWNDMEYWEQKHHNSLGKARTKGAEIVDTDAIREYYREVFTKPNGICTYCHGQFDIKDITIDHRHPYALGGRHEISNFVVSCCDCNVKKNAKPYETWLAIK